MGWTAGDAREEDDMVPCDASDDDPELEVIGKELTL